MRPATITRAQAALPATRAELGISQAVHAHSASACACEVGHRQEVTPEGSSPSGQATDPPMKTTPRALRRGRIGEEFAYFGQASISSLTLEACCSASAATP